MYYDNDFDPDTIKFLKLKNNIFIKFKNGTTCDNPYFIILTEMNTLHQAIFMNI